MEKIQDCLGLNPPSRHVLGQGDRTSAPRPWSGPRDTPTLPSLLPLSPSLSPLPHPPLQNGQKPDGQGHSELPSPYRPLLAVSETLSSRDDLAPTSPPPPPPRPRLGPASPVSTASPLGNPRLQPPVPCLLISSCLPTHARCDLDSHNSVSPAILIPFPVSPAPNSFSLTWVTVQSLLRTPQALPSLCSWSKGMSLASPSPRTPPQVGSQVVPPAHRAQPAASAQGAPGSFLRSSPLPLSPPSDRHRTQRHLWSWPPPGPRHPLASRHPDPVCTVSLRHPPPSPALRTEARTVL